MKWKILLLLCAGIIGGSSTEQVLAQQANNLETNLVRILNSGYGEDYIKGYTQPFVNAFSIAMSGGLFHRGSVKQFPHLDFGMNIPYMRVPTEAKYFQYAGEQQPTFFGSSQVDSSNIPGTDLTEFFLPQIQLNLGMTSTAELIVRGSLYTINEIGEIQLVGIGIKYGLTDILTKSLLSMNVSVQAIYQTMKVDDWLHSATFGMNIQASSILLAHSLEMYTGLGYEISESKFDTNKLTGVGSNGIGEIRLEGKNHLRIILGLSYALYFLNFHMDYNLGYYPSAAAGVMVDL
jgi:hypothetical protein